MKIITVLMILYFGVFLHAESVNTFFDEQFVEKQFLITKSTKSYKEAKEFAKKLANKTGVKLNFRGLNYNKSLMLSESKKVCNNNAFEYPCYEARGRYDNGVYISIEYSGAYKNFRDGYYIVMAASGEKTKDTLKLIRSVVKGAYIKTSKVYMGCMH